MPSQKFKNYFTVLHALLVTPVSMLNAASFFCYVNAISGQTLVWAVVYETDIIVYNSMITYDDK